MMQTRSFILTGTNSQKAFEEFLNDPKVSIKDRFFSPKPTWDSADIVYYVYETLDEPAVVKAQQVDVDKEKLREVIRLARLVGPEDVQLLLKGLKNQQSRDDFLLAKYNIGGRDAGHVCDLLKPEMEYVLSWEG